MHDVDKVGYSATGRLVRYRMNVELNPFPVGVSLMKTSHKVSTVLAIATAWEYFMLLYSQWGWSK